MIPHEPKGIGITAGQEFTIGQSPFLTLVDTLEFRMPNTAPLIMPRPIPGNIFDLLIHKESCHVDIPQDRAILAAIHRTG